MKRRPTIPFLAAAAACAVLAFAAGCDTLPEGDPPEGNLTDNTPPPVTSPLALRNHLTTQLIVFALVQMLVLTLGLGETRMRLRLGSVLNTVIVSRESFLQSRLEQNSCLPSSESLTADALQSLFSEGSEISARVSMYSKPAPVYR